MNLKLYGAQAGKLMKELNLKYSEMVLKHGHIPSSVFICQLLHKTDTTTRHGKLTIHIPRSVL
jgi:hypothetical protein